MASSSMGHLRNFSKAMSSMPCPWKESPSILFVSTLSASMRSFDCSVKRYPFDTSTM